MVKMLKALESDAEKLLEIQQKAFIVYSQKYGEAYNYGYQILPNGKQASTVPFNGIE